MNANNLDADVIPDVKSIAEFSYSSTEQQKTYNRIIVFNCTDAWAPICIFLLVSGQNESVQLKPIGTL